MAKIKWNSRQLCFRDIIVTNVITPTEHQQRIMCISWYSNVSKRCYQFIKTSTTRLCQLLVYDLCCLWPWNEKSLHDDSTQYGRQQSFYRRRGISNWIFAGIIVTENPSDLPNFKVVHAHEPRSNVFEYVSFLLFFLVVPSHLIF